MRVCAKIEFGKADLIKLYELMYKWGMIQAHAGQEGWISDSAASLLRQVEPELNSYLNLGLAALEYEFDQWLEWHSQYLSTPVEDDEQLQEDFAKDFLDENDIETTVEVTTNEEALSYIDENNLFNEYLEWLKNNAATNDEYDTAYARISDAKDMISLFINTSSNPENIPDKIEAFNTALMTEHTGGIMTENISQSFPEITKNLLDDLSSGAYTETWNRDLRQIGIRANKMKLRVSADTWEWTTESAPEEESIDFPYFSNEETKLVSDFVDSYYVKSLTNLIKKMLKGNNTEENIINSVADFLRKEISSSFFRGKELRNDLVTQALNEVDWNTIIMPYIKTFSGPEFMDYEEQSGQLEKDLSGLVEDEPEEVIPQVPEKEPEVAPKPPVTPKKPRTKKPASDPTNWTNPEWTYTY